MLTRVAVFEGSITEGSEYEFFAAVAARLEPIWRSFSNVEDVRVLRTRNTDPGAIRPAPRADPLQAWSAAALPFMVTELLGLHADGFGHRLHVRRPMLPDGVNGLALHDLRAAGGNVSLGFTRRGEAVEVDVLASGGDVEVVVE